MNRRNFLRGMAAVALSAIAASLYSLVIEPCLRLKVRRWRVTPEGWAAAPLRIAILSDLHVGEPAVSLKRLQRIVARTNALGADLIVFLGDLPGDHPFVTREVPLDAAAAVLGGLSAPLGVWAVLGNHDWWNDPAAMARGGGPLVIAGMLEANGITVLHNRAVRLGAAEGGFWLAGLGDQWVFSLGEGRYRGLDDLPGTLAQIGDDAPVVLMAHEPDIFPRVPDRVAVTLSGHTHGGQIRLFGWSPVVPSAFGNRYAYGPVREGGRDLVVSGGIGCSILPVRFGMPPEITLLDVAAKSG